MRRFPILLAYLLLPLGCSDSGEDFGLAKPDASTGGTGGSGGATGGTSGEGGTSGSSGTGGEGGTGGYDAGDGGDAEAGAAGTGGTDAGDAEAESYCDPTSKPSEDACVIHEDYGIFVSPGGTDEASCGTPTSPCATLQYAMTQAKNGPGRVYACGNAGTYEESLSVDTALDGIEVYGGFDCSADWSWDASIKAQVMPTSPGVAMAIDGLTTGISFEQMRFESRGRDDGGHQFHCRDGQWKLGRRFRYVRDRFGDWGGWG